MGRRGTRCLSGFLVSGARPQLRLPMSRGGGSRESLHVPGGEYDGRALGDWRSARCSDCVVINARRSLAVRGTRARRRGRCGQGLHEGDGTRAVWAAGSSEEKESLQAESIPDTLVRPNLSVSRCRARGATTGHAQNQRVACRWSFVCRFVHGGGTLCRVDGEELW